MIPSTDSILYRIASHALFASEKFAEGVIQFLFTDQCDDLWHFVPVSDYYQAIKGIHPSPLVFVTTTLVALENLSLGELKFENLTERKKFNIVGDVYFFAEFARNVTARRDRWLAAYAKDEARAKAFPTSELRRYHQPSANNILECLEMSIPAIFNGMMEDWNWSNWTFELLIQNFGNNILYKRENSTVFFGEHIKNLLAGISRTTGGIKLPDGLYSEIINPKLGNGIRTESAFIFIGAKNSVTPLHRDLGHGINAHVIGQKSWILFSPDQTPYLYPREDERFLGFQECYVNINDPDYKKYPNFAFSRPLIVTVNPGEILMIPSGWYHEVRLMDTALSIGFPISKDFNYE